MEVCAPFPWRGHPVKTEELSGQQSLFIASHAGPTSTPTAELSNKVGVPQSQLLSVIT